MNISVFGSIRICAVQFSAVAQLNWDLPPFTALELTSVHLAFFFSGLLGSSRAQDKSNTTIMPQYFTCPYSPPPPVIYPSLLLPPPTLYDVQVR